MQSIVFKMDNIPYFNAEQVRTTLHYDQLVPIIEETLASFSLDSPDGRVHQPLRATAVVKKNNGYQHKFLYIYFFHQRLVT